eukprot:scaffold8185_cov239-Pinguiococcus_pyrenoidosus.AAC.2
MVAELHQRPDDGQHVLLAPSHDVLHGFRRQHLLVDARLQVRDPAADDLDQLRGQELRVQRVLAPQDELVDDLRHLVLAVLHLLHLRIGRVGLSALQNRALEAPAELGRRAQHLGIGEVDHGVELLQIILHRRAGQQEAPPAGERRQGLGRGRLRVFEAMGLVADEHVAALSRIPLEAIDLDAESLVGNDEHSEDLVPQETVNGAFHGGSARLRAGHVGAAVAEPLLDLGRPVPHKTGRTHHNRLLHGRRTVKALAQERPQHNDALKRLAEAHVVSEDAALAAEVLQAHHALEHKRHTLSLVRSEHSAKLGIHLDGKLVVVLGLRLPQHERLEGRPLFFVAFFGVTAIGDVLLVVVGKIKGILVAWQQGQAGGGRLPELGGLQKLQGALHSQSFAPQERHTLRGARGASGQLERLLWVQLRRLVEESEEWRALNLYRSAGGKRRIFAHGVGRLRPGRSFPRAP